MGKGCKSLHPNPPRSLGTFGYVAELQKLEVKYSIRLERMLIILIKPFITPNSGLGIVIVTFLRLRLE